MADERNDEMLTLTAAAEIANVAPITLQKAISRSHTLPARKHGRDWIILRSDLDNWMNNPANHRRGRPTKP